MSIERKKMELELMRVKTAKMDLEVKIEERLEEIEKMKMHIEIQEKRVIELTEQLSK